METAASVTSVDRVASRGWRIATSDQAVGVEMLAMT
jgi:hypothetical protein